MQQHLGERPWETSFFFFFYKAAVITSTPHQNRKGIPVCFCWFGARNRNFSPFHPLSLFFVFANDAEIGNHFVFSVIMNIWCVPSGRVVVWWVWPWLLVKKGDVNVQAGSGWAIFGKISDAHIFPSTGGGVLYEWIHVVLFVFMVVT